MFLQDLQMVLQLDRPQFTLDRIEERVLQEIAQALRAQVLIDLRLMEIQVQLEIVLQQDLLLIVEVLEAILQVVQEGHLVQQEAVEILDRAVQLEAAQIEVVAEVVLQEVLLHQEVHQQEALLHQEVLLQQEVLHREDHLLEVLLLGVHLQEVVLQDVVLQDVVTKNY
jgi:hypothetical protein